MKAIRFHKLVGLEVLQFDEVLIVDKVFILKIRWDIGIYMISDYYLSKNYEETPKKINWIGIFSWISGVIVMLVITSQIKNILGIILAAAVYYMLQKI